MQLECSAAAISSFASSDTGHVHEGVPAKRLSANLVGNGYNPAQTQVTTQDKRLLDERIRYNSRLYLGGGMSDRYVIQPFRVPPVGRLPLCLVHQIQRLCILGTVGAGCSFEETTAVELVVAYHDIGIASEAAV